MAGGSNALQCCGGARPEGAGGERQKQVIYVFCFFFPHNKSVFVCFLLISVVNRYCEAAYSPAAQQDPDAEPRLPRLPRLSFPPAFRHNEAGPGAP